MITIAQYIGNKMVARTQVEEKDAARKIAELNKRAAKNWTFCPAEWRIADSK